MMTYHNPIKDKNGNTHSIDMVYCTYYSVVSISGILETLRAFHESHPEVPYEEYLDRPCHSKYDFFRDGVSIGGAYIDMGKYRNYDRLTKTFDIFNMWQLRVNPNKHYEKPWFKDLLAVLLPLGTSGFLRKYDYAVDIPTEPKNVLVLHSRKEEGLYKGTRYYGQSGRHGYTKVYDKKKERSKVDPDMCATTRVETTLFTGKELSLEEVAYLDGSAVKTDLSELNDNDRAIVEMYRRLKALDDPYELKLCRKKMAKLKDYVTGGYTVLDYEDILERLLNTLKKEFCVSDIVTDEDGFLQVDDEDLPFD